MKMKTSPKDVSNVQILQELKKLTATDSDIKQELKQLTNKVDGLSTKVEGLSDKIDVVHMESMEAIHELADQSGKMEFRVNRVEARMVTKDYLDDKLADQYSKIIAHTDRRIQKALG